MPFSDSKKKGPFKIKQSDGSYTTFHPDTRADIVYRVSNGTIQNTSVEDSLQNIENVLDNKSEIPFVKGTQTSKTSNWTGVLDTVTALYDGFSIRYWIPYRNNADPVTLQLTLKDNIDTGVINCYSSSESRLSNRYSAGTLLLLTYRSAIIDNTISNSGWYCEGSYDYSAFTSIIVGGTTIDANTPNDSIEFVAGNNITLSVENNKITINASDTTHSASFVVANNNTSTTNTTSELTNGNIYLNHVENNVVNSSHKIYGNGSIDVSTNVNGDIVINGISTTDDTI